MSLAPLAAIGGFGAGEHPHQRGFSRAVGRDERNAIAPLDVDRDVVEDDEVAVRLVDVVQLEHRAAALRTDRKGESHALALGRHLDRHDPVEHLDPALDLRGLGGLVAEPVDERAHPRHFLVLLVLGLAQMLEPRVALDQIVRVGADVVGDRAEGQLRDLRHDGVEKEAIV